jgi:hypothetical protein
VLALAEVLMASVAIAFIKGGHPAKVGEYVRTKTGSGMQNAESRLWSTMALTVLEKRLL